VNLSDFIRKKRSKFVIRLHVSVFTVTSTSADLLQSVDFTLTRTLKFFLFPYVLIITICFATDLFTRERHFQNLIHFTFSLSTLRVMGFVRDVS
jgi:hypothetical protein